MPIYQICIDCLFSMSVFEAGYEVNVQYKRVASQLLST